MSVKRTSIRKSIVHASQAFKLQDGTEAGDLVIENERLKTTLQILQQKLKLQTDSDEQFAKLRKQVQELDTENSSLKSEVA